MPSRSTSSKRLLTWCELFLSLVVSLLTLPAARASVSLFMEEPYARFGAWNPTGHTAIYLDHVCADTFTELRRCRPGETGVVLSRYHKVHGDDWIAMPLIPYLFAVDTLDQAPSKIDLQGKARYRDAYWAAHLKTLAAPDPSGGAPKGNWTQLVGSSFDRTTYVFQMDTSAEQDDAVIAYLNGKSDKSHFNLFFNNCSNYAGDLLNIYFPNSVHRNAVADFGLMTPKQAARSVVKFGRRHPELHPAIFILPQVPGTLHRSHPVDGIAEALVKSKRWLIPLLILQPEIPAYSAIAYLTKGRLQLPADPIKMPLPE